MIASARAIAALHDRRGRRGARLVFEMNIHFLLQ
jgi:hypothetical protein